ncbi:MAG TPA: sporulation peptidase YabG [Firmicutes bacterium]|nr:sporulation peptidase YabG [Bacillota bacterium]
MEKISVGDTVSRKSYGADLLFVVVRIAGDSPKNAKALLRGLNVRLYADAPLSDLVKVSLKEVERIRLNLIKQSKDSARKVFLRRVAEENLYRYRAGAERPEGHEFFELPGKVLHVDGDRDYLRDCLDYYRQLGVPVIGEYVPEERQPSEIMSLLETHLPEIVVLTGHDGLLTKKGADRAGIDSYRTSRFFVEAVRKARRFQPDKDALVIIAGACQSHYEALLAAGANFASSPERVFIHAYDPILVAEKISYTPIDHIVHVYEVVENTITGIKGIGGIETRGKFRLGLPKTVKE